MERWNPAEQYAPRDFAPGEQAKVPRYSLAYLVRQRGDAPMKRLSGGDSLVLGLDEGKQDNLMNARKWEAKRTVVIRDGRGNARSRGDGDEVEIKTRPRHN